MLRPLKPSVADALFRSRAFAYVGVISFERRATACLRDLGKRGTLPSYSVIFDYDTIADPPAEDRELRASSKHQFESLLHGRPHFLTGPTNAFALNVLTSLMDQELASQATSLVFIDITCMTRIHLFASVAIALKLEALGKTVIYGYSSAHSYGISKQELFGWRDVLFVAASNAPRDGGDVLSHGIISAGHDGERLSVALQELEPSSGLFIYPQNEKRPDFTAKAMLANEAVQRRLSVLRSPQRPGSPAGTDRWHFEQIEVDDFQTLSERVQSQLDLASASKGMLAIYPFGPKPMTLCIADRVRRSSVPAWAVYPVPDRFAVSYSSGTGTLSLFSSATSPAPNEA